MSCIYIPHENRSQVCPIYDYSSENSSYQIFVALIMWFWSLQQLQQYRGHLYSYDKHKKNKISSSGELKLS